MSKKFLTRIDGSTASLTGRVTASAFAGDGSALTNLPSSTSSAFNNLSASGTASVNNLTVYSNASVSGLINGVNISAGSLVFDNGIVAIGNYILTSSVGNSNNSGIVAIGSNVLPAAETIIQAVYIGDGAGANTASGEYNVGIGSSPLNYVITGDSNVAIGQSPLQYASSAWENVAIGTGAVGGYGYSVNFSPSANIGIGRGALADVTNGAQNVALGVQALFSIKTGGRNIAIGRDALRYANSASYNIAIGDNSGNYGGAINNISIGRNSGSSMYGSHNVILGAYSGATIPTASNKIILADGAGNLIFNSDAALSTSSFTGKVYAASFVGDGSGLTGISSGTTGSAFTNISASGTASINNLTVYGTPTLPNNTIAPAKLTASTITITGTSIGLGGSLLTIGASALSASIITIGTTSVGLGASITALTGLTTASLTGRVTASALNLSDNIAISASGNTMKIGFGTGSTNIVFGNGSPLSSACAVAENNIAIGQFGPLLFMKNGSLNVAIGYGALRTASFGGSNVAIGFGALQNGIQAQQNVAVGAGTLNSASSDGNTAIGQSALNGIISGGYNVAVGYAALASSASGNYNTAIGYTTLNQSKGARNIGIGERAGQYLINGDYNVYIGSQTAAPTELGLSGSSNNIIIADGQGNIAATFDGISGKFTVSRAASFTNTVTAASFIGDGTGLTGITSGGSITTASTAPSSPTSGQQWLDTTTGILYTYVDDSSGSATNQWVELAPGGFQGTAGTITVGTTASSTSASVWNTGDSNNAVFNFLVPKGDTGPSGPAAPAGGAITVLIDGYGIAPGTGVKAYVEVPFSCSITKWTMLADVTGSATVDVWKDTYANYPPTVADSITASSYITISGATKGQDSTLTGWTRTINAGDILAFNLRSVTASITQLSIILSVDKT